MMTFFTVLLIVCSLIICRILFFSHSLEVKPQPEESRVLNDREISPEEKATRELIGDNKYEEMASHVSHLLKKHAGESFRTVMLTAGSIERNALHILHSLLPGDAVRLQNNTRHGIPDVGVYAGEERIGRLLLDDATEALDVLTNSKVTGSYVAEQNSYGDASEKIAVKLIIFFTSLDTVNTPARRASDTPYKVVYRGPRPIVIYQN